MKRESAFIRDFKYKKIGNDFLVNLTESLSELLVNLTVSVPNRKKS